MFGFDTNKPATDEPADNSQGVPPVDTTSHDDSSYAPADTSAPTTVSESVDLPEAAAAPEPAVADMQTYQATPAPVADVIDNSTLGATADLLAIKKEAMQHLSPLVSHLDQTPEEKFKTTMMMIQAADDQALVPKAYEAAKAITDEKARAQALLDIINEINYFTQAGEEKN